MIAALPGVRSASRGSVLIVSGTDPASPAGHAARPPWSPSTQAVVTWLGGRWSSRDGCRGRIKPRKPRSTRSWPSGAACGWARSTASDLHDGAVGPAGEGVPPRPEGPTVELRITGIVRHPSDLLPPVDGNDDFDTDETSGLVPDARLLAPLRT